MTPNIPRYRYGYKSDEWGMNRALGLIADPNGDVCRWDDVKHLLEHIAALEKLIKPKE